MSTISKIRASVDLHRHGKQHGHLQVPNSSNTSGWGSVLMPITVIANGSGPTVLFTGGNHGDEYEGPLALLKLARDLLPEQVQGRLIILPALNYPALMAGTRLSPIDGCNMNRVFPGRHDGSATELIAHYVFYELVTQADAVIDLHSGGSSMIFSPCAVIHRLDDADQQQACLAAGRAFGAPLLLVLRELDRDGMLDSVVEDLGKVFVSTELGGGAMVSPRTLAIAERGVRNMLRHLGMLAGQPEGESSRLLETPDDAYTMAWVDGLYEPCAEVGSVLRGGDFLGRIHGIDALEREPLALRAPRDGVLITRAGRGWVRRGDTVAVLASDVTDL